MRILIFGVSGLIGHSILNEFSGEDNVFGTLHRSKKKYRDYDIFSNKNIIENVDVKNFDYVKQILNDISPDVILNCVGITKRKIDLKDPLNVLLVNSVFPHQLAKWANDKNKRVIHFSTDCVFNGKVGNYNEKSLTTADDLYGRSKALGEIIYSHTLTIRSSFIGLELYDKTELLDWFISQEGKKIKGFTNTMYSGVSTLFMSRLIKKIIYNHPNLSGLYQLATESPISKYELLCIAKESFKLNIDIIRDNNLKHYPTLDGSKLKKKLNIKIPSWHKMMLELANYKKTRTL